MILSVPIGITIGVTFGEAHHYNIFWCVVIGMIAGPIIMWRIIRFFGTWSVNRELKRKD